MKIKSYTRKEYLAYCDKNGIKTLLTENERNPYTISGYPTIRPLGKIVDSCDADEWYYNHW